MTGRIAAYYADAFRKAGGMAVGRRCVFGGWDPTAWANWPFFLRKKCKNTGNIDRFVEFHFWCWLRRGNIWEYDIDIASENLLVVACGGTDLTIFEIHARRSQKQRSHRWLWCHCGKMKQVWHVVTNLVLGCWICMSKERTTTSYPNVWLPGLRSLRNFGLQRRDCYSLQMYLLVVWTIQAIINGTAFL